MPPCGVREKDLLVAKFCYVLLLDSDVSWCRLDTYLLFLALKGPTSENCLLFSVMFLKSLECSTWMSDSTRGYVQDAGDNWMSGRTTAGAYSTAAQDGWLHDCSSGHRRLIRCLHEAIVAAIAPCKLTCNCNWTCNRIGLHATAVSPRIAWIKHV